ncbi:M15 family metallopeptidase [Nannocystaceae bacterium ST9]
MSARAIRIPIASLLALACESRAPEPSELATREPEPTIEAPTSVEIEAPMKRSTRPTRPSEAPAPCTLVDPPAGFVDLRVAIPSVRIAAGYHRPDNFTGARLPGYEAAGAWFDETSARALTHAADELAAAGFGLIVHDAYRPRRASEAMVAWARAHDREDLLADGWVAARSLHNRGVAIDLGLYGLAEGEVIDMGSAWDHFGPTSSLRGVEGPALEHRLRLRAAMVRAGFEPYAREWWHFTDREREQAPVHDDPYRCRATLSEPALDQ